MSKVSCHFVQILFGRNSTLTLVGVIILQSPKIKGEQVRWWKEFRMRQPLFYGNHNQKRPILTLFIFFPKHDRIVMSDSFTTREVFGSFGNEPMQSCSVRRCCCRCHCHLCTAIPVTALIIETSYLADICTCSPSLCT